MTEISAVIITLNEERNIRRCLDSLDGVADEVIVLDSGSTDKTEEICNEYQEVKFTKVEWRGYSGTKNYGNSIAKYPYILSLDADEALSKELAFSIQQAKTKLEGAYYFSRLTFYCGKPVKYSGWYPDFKVRLFPAQSAQWVGDYVHETLELSPGCQKQQLTGDLLHYSFYSVKDHMERIERYTDLAAERNKAKGKTGGKVKGVLSAFVRFIKIYFFKLGILDGTVGWHIAVKSAHASYMKNLKTANLIKNER